MGHKNDAAESAQGILEDIKIVRLGTKKDITVWAFQACVIANNAFGFDETMYRYSKLVMLVFFSVVIFSTLLRGGRIHFGKQLLLPVLVAIYSLASIIWSYDVNVAWAQLITQLQLYVLLFFSYLIVYNEAKLEDYFDALYASGWAMAIFALLQYGGLSNYLAYMEYGYRMGGIVSNENTFGLVFSNATIIAVSYMLFRKQKIHIVSIIVFVFFALSSGSKKAVLLIMAGVLAIIVLHYGVKKIYKTILISAGILVAVWLVLQLPLFKTIYKRLITFLSGEADVSNDARKIMIQFGLDMFWERPLLGWGLNNYRVFYPTGQYSHNNFVELLVSGGIIAFILFYLMYLLPIFSTVLPRNRKFILENKIYAILVVCLVLDIVFGYGMVQMYRKGPHILLGVALAFADKLDCLGTDIQRK